MARTLKITAPDVLAAKGHRRLAAVTAYDATFARLFDAAGVDVLLVGDSVGMVFQGQATTLPVTLQDMVYHTRAVVRGATRAQVVADLPFGSYQTGPEQAVASAVTLMKEGGAEAVKLEGGAEIAESVRRVVACGIPVMGHVGLTPQSVHRFGGFRVQGRSDSERRALLRDAIELQEAGAYSLVVEGVPSDVAQEITQTLTIPTIGIGAGVGCDGQVLVSYDFLGLFTDFKPRFVKHYANLAEVVSQATAAYVDEVRAGQFPGPEHSFSPSARVAPKPAEETGAGALTNPGPPSYGPADEAVKTGEIVP